MDLLSNMPDLLTGAAAFLPHVDHFLPNEEQAAAMTGETDPEKAAQALLKQGPSTVIVTLGAEEASSRPCGVHRLPVLPVEVVDTRGAATRTAPGSSPGSRKAGRPGGGPLGHRGGGDGRPGLGSDACLTDLDAVLALLD